MSGGVPAGELLPCPFCGTAAEILENPSEKHGVEHTGRYFVRCSPCDLIIDSAWDVSYDDAVRAWNARTTPAGWVLVPVEPTLDMKDSATTIAVDTGQCSITALNWEEAAEVWSAMLAATPTPPIEGRDADVERVA